MMSDRYRKMVKQLREEYPAGTRIRLIKMDDIQAPPPNTEGTVINVDDLGDIRISWDTGGSLAIIPTIDQFEKLS